MIRGKSDKYLFYCHYVIGISRKKFFDIEKKSMMFQNNSLQNDSELFHGSPKSICTG